MRKVVVSLALAILFSLPVLAQDNNNKFEIFGGYQYTRVSPGPGFSGVNLNGWNASATYNAKNWLGATADFSSGYGTAQGVNSHLTNFLFGPTVSYSKADHFKPFAHVLFGVSETGGALENVSAPTSAFAWALGGGVDANITRHVALRLFQADYFMSRFNSQDQNNTKISSGFVYRF